MPEQRFTTSRYTDNARARDPARSRPIRPRWHTTSYRKSFVSTSLCGIQLLVADDNSEYNSPEVGESNEPESINWSTLVQRVRDGEEDGMAQLYSIFEG